VSSRELPINVRKKIKAQDRSQEGLGKSAKEGNCALSQPHEPGQSKVLGIRGRDLSGGSSKRDRGILLRKGGAVDRIRPSGSRKEKGE